MFKIVAHATGSTRGIRLYKSWSPTAKDSGDMICKDERAPDPKPYFGYACERSWSRGQIELCSLRLWRPPTKRLMNQLKWPACSHKPKRASGRVNVSSGIYRGKKFLHSNATIVNMAFQLLCGGAYALLGTSNGLKEADPSLEWHEVASITTTKVTIPHSSVQ